MKSKKVTSNNFLELLAKHTPLLIITHENPDGDAIGAIFGLKTFLNYHSLSSTVLLSESLPSAYNNLINKEDYEYLTNPDEFSKYKGIVVLDSANTSRTILKDLATTETSSVIFNIDHHVSNDLFGDFNWVEPKWSSTCEGLVRLLKGEQALPKESARLFLMGILTDTGYLAFAAAGLDTLEIVTYLYKNGVSISEIHRSVKENMNKRQMKLWGYAIYNCQYEDEYGIIWSSIPNQIYSTLNVKDGDSEGLVEFFRRYRDCRLALLIREVEPSILRVSLRSKGEVDVNSLASIWGGGGHPRAAGFTISGELNLVLKEILDIIKGKIGICNH
ncbi:MAG: Bifunctional oligoribonuclease and PAP phosphatase NrnA [candidate division WS2 bacterium]|uniref:Bifunctional oligoribonuclease and PAP phosphatase NrnA n=1 Tax=Psychracetigena formicireducens TaxID=2986056 RepID=A0A9E2BHJ8_PSYF1|nr:Bifunctional oligoribonuclease and PAP phosphatase NrnA [Candidatus Psychracetigena formicireducens]MBT9144265.1 Bifunctional oligoribonuclease and PAP phosphatase NrnA [Candidatus Psychracetigena formicireducens]MBT9150437.1 Bifunctional oligoribonuclease and PAP phosphatase NrnA [Candidatus Psychracetigena formicireducens]